MRKAIVPAAVTLIALCAFASQVAAQIVKGRVVIDGTETPLADVSVRLRASNGRIVASTMTSSTGEFRLHASRLGAVTLIAERIGLQTVTTAEIQVDISQAIEVEIGMSETAVVLEPLTVRAREYADIGPLSGYFERMQRAEKLGFGTVISRDEIQARDALDVADLLREIPRVSIVQQRNRDSHVVFRGGARGTCVPKIYVNGVFANRGGPAIVDEMVRPNELEGVEVYRGLSEMPGEYYDETHCGVILLWTRRDSEGARPMTWKRVLLTLGGIVIFSALLFH
ncbi:MAG TPA: TonB-dependent receptor [Longimicrobiales bacterium]|nr:TonB-dependent receptor [Longimicrobiales bacterium]